MSLIEIVSFPLSLSEINMILNVTPDSVHHQQYRYRLLWKTCLNNVKLHITIFLKTVHSTVYRLSLLLPFPPKFFLFQFKEIDNGFLVLLSLDKQNLTVTSYLLVI